MKRLHGLVLGLVGLAGLAATPPVASWLADGTEIVRYEIQSKPVHSVPYPGQGTPSDDPTKYVVLPDGSLTFKAHPVPASYRTGLTDPAERPSHLWLIKLPKPLSRY